MESNLPPPTPTNVNAPEDPDALPSADSSTEQLCWLVQCVLWLERTLLEMRRDFREQTANILAAHTPAVSQQPVGGSHPMFPFGQSASPWPPLGDSTMGHPPQNTHLQGSFQQQDTGYQFFGSDMWALGMISIFCHLQF